MMRNKNIHLRALEAADIDMLYEWENNEEVWKISDTQMPFSRFQLEQYIATPQDVYAQRQMRFVICKNSESQPVGLVDLFDFNPNHKRLGIGILIAEEAQRGKGYAKEAILSMLDHSYMALDCINVYCNITADNHRSIALFESLGFELVGEKKKWIREGDGFKNELLYQRLRDND